MDRHEVVAALREAYEQGGMALLAAIADDIRQHGPLRDPEFFICVDCGVEQEMPPNGLTRGGVTVAQRCRPCHWKRNRPS